MDASEFASRRAAMMAKIEANIERAGWSCIGVFSVVGENPSPPFSYTVGLRKTFGHPELIVYGLGAENGEAVLAGAVELIRDGATLEPGERYGKILKDLDVEIRGLGAPGCPLNIARAYYGGAVEARQIVWPDAAGVFPLEAGFDPKLNGAQVFPDGTEADS